MHLLIENIGFGQSENSRRGRPRLERCFAANQEAYPVNYHSHNSNLKPFSETGEPYFHGTIITREDSGIEQPQDLPGKTFALRPHSSLLPPTLSAVSCSVRVSKAQVDTKSFRHYTTVLQKVLQGEFDAGAVRNIVVEKISYKNAEKLYKVKIK